MNVSWIRQFNLKMRFKLKLATIRFFLFRSEHNACTQLVQQPEKATWTALDIMFLFLLPQTNTSAWQFITLSSKGSDTHTRIGLQHATEHLSPLSGLPVYNDEDTVQSPCDNFQTIWTYV